VKSIIESEKAYLYTPPCIYDGEKSEEKEEEDWREEKENTNLNSRETESSSSGSSESIEKASIQKKKKISEESLEYYRKQLKRINVVKYLYDDKKKQMLTKTINWSVFYLSSSHLSKTFKKNQQYNLIRLPKNVNSYLQYVILSFIYLLIYLLICVFLEFG
jgi:hypothetical protein